MSAPDPNVILYPRMAQTAVLVDLANCAVLRGLTRPNQALVGARLDEFLTPLGDTLSRTLRGSHPELWVRLYDGWFDGTGRGTDLYLMTRQHLRDYYPTRRRSYRVFVHLAEGLVAAPSDRLVDTLRAESGLGRYPVTISPASPEACVDPALCPISHLRSWIRGHCPRPVGSVPKLVEVAHSSVTSWIILHFRRPSAPRGRDSCASR
jgi:hypothetical protein